MCRRPMWLSATLIVAIVFPVAAANADVRSPVKIRMRADTTQPAISGQDYSGLLELITPADGVIDRIVVSGDGWLVLAVGLEGPTPALRGVPVQVPFEARVLDASSKLEVRVSFNGQVTIERFNLSAERLAWIGRDRPSIQVEPTEHTDTIQEGAAGDGHGPRGCDDRLIRVRGRIEYVRPDGQVIGADGIHYQIMDEDTVDSEVMFDSYTDEQGQFDVTICWDDCDISGCDDPDIYLRYECDTGVVNVHNNDAGEDTYSWSTIDTLVFEDDTSDDVNFGNQRPSDPGTFPAIHMHNSVTRAHRFVLENNGANIPKVSLVWNDDGWAFYRPDDQEINIGPTHQWSEATHVHEWGHHLLYEWTDPLDVDYCNGFCDDRGVDVCGMEGCVDNGGHCLWCNETDHDAWNEGFPDWLGSVVTRMWQARYGGPPPSSVNELPLETTDTCCDGTAHDGLITEGFVGALLRDIEDGVQDPGQSACPQDCLALGPDEILAVVKASRPVRVMEFINAFRAALPNVEFDFRSTALSVSDDYVAGWSLPTLQLLGMNGCGTYRTGETIQLSVDTNASQYSTCMRWQRNGADVMNTTDGHIAGATTDLLTITNATAADAGLYTLRIRSCDGAPPNECDGSTQSTTSPPISVRVIDANPLGHRITGWGRNTYGMLGRGSTLPDSDVNPDDVINLTNAVTVSAGYWNSIAAMSDGTAWCWGSRYLGNGTSDMSATPVQVNFLTDVVAVAAGSPEGNCMALDANGHVWTWGSNYQGLLGYSQPNGFALNPGQVNLECVVKISLGNYHVAAITGDGSLWMWGSNLYGELGKGNTGGSSQFPVRVTDLADVIDVDCGGGHTLALRADGTLWACGWNNYGQLGDGTTQSRNRFVQVSGLANVAGMAAGQLHSVARLANGQAWAWGYNGEHALGTGAPMWASYPTPAPVINVGNVRAVDAGYALSVFTAADGTIWTCGSNGSGQLGRPFNGTESGYLPAPVDTRVGASVIASAGVSFVMAIAPGARIIAPVADQFVAGCATASLTVGTVGEPPLNYQWGRNVGGLFVPLNETARVTGTTTPTLTISPTQPLDTDLYQVIVTNATNTVRSNIVNFETPPRVNKFNGPLDTSRWANERGNWAIVDGSYAAGTPAIYQNSAYSSFTLPQSDFLIELDVVNASHANFDTNGGIYLRSSLSPALPYPRGVALAFGEAYPWGGGDVYWHRNYGSGYNGAQNIAHNVYTAGQTLHLRIEVRGDTYTAWANDSLTPTTTFVTPDFPSGKIALLDGVANGTSFDNIFIQSLTSCEPGSGIEPVRIIQRPQSQTVLSGTLVTLTVAATGTEPLSYQWLRNGECIDGATDSSFAFTAAVGATGRFECTVTNTCGSVGSYPAMVSLDDRPPGDADGAENADHVGAVRQP